MPTDLSEQPPERRTRYKHAFIGCDGPPSAVHCPKLDAWGAKGWHVVSLHVNTHGETVYVMSKKDATDA